jgi:hypothetical protein
MPTTLGRGSRQEPVRGSSKTNLMLDEGVNWREQCNMQARQAQEPPRVSLYICESYHAARTVRLRICCVSSSNVLLLDDEQSFRQPSISADKLIRACSRNDLEFANLARHEATASDLRRITSWQR